MRLRSFCLALSFAAAGALEAQLWEARDQLLYLDPEVGGAGEVLVAGHLDEDGFADLLAGAPQDDSDSGNRSTFSGSALGLGFDSEANGATLDRLRAAFAFGDFDGDGDLDYAEGVPGYSFGGIREGHVMLYEVEGASTSFAGELRQSLAGVPGAAEAGDEFGAALTSGDFNGDGVDDLAVGSPGEAVGAISNAGAVTIFYGEKGTGLVTANSSLWHLDVDGIPGTAATGDRLGSSLAAYNDNCGSYDELAVGIADKTIGGKVGAGAVLFLTGSSLGITTSNATLIDESFFTVLDESAETGEHFGFALADSGTFFNICGGVWIGAPRDLDGVGDATGAVYHWHGFTAQLVRWDADDLGSTAEESDLFGYALAKGDFNGDGDPDIAIGSPGEQFLLSSLTGAAHVVYSNAGVADLDATQFFSSRRGLEIYDEIDEEGAFGAAVAAGDFNGDGLDDLAIGLPEAIFPLAHHGGAIEVLYAALFADDFEGNDFGEWSSHVP